MYVQDNKRKAELIDRVIHQLYEQFENSMPSIEKRKGVASIEDFAYEQTSPEITNFQ